MTLGINGKTYDVNELIAYHKRLEKENAELQDELKKWKDGIALKDEEIGCIETDFNTFKSKAREIIREYSKWECEYCDYKRTPDYVTMHCSQCQKYLLHKKAEQFLKENE